MSTAAGDAHRRAVYGQVHPGPRGIGQVGAGRRQRRGTHTRARARHTRRTRALEPWLWGLHSRNSSHSTGGTVDGPGPRRGVVQGGLCAVRPRAPRARGHRLQGADLCLPHPDPHHQGYWIYRTTRTTRTTHGIRHDTAHDTTRHSLQIVVVVAHKDSKR